MKVQVKFDLEQIPRSVGGVKYKAQGRKDFSMYIPQDFFPTAPSKQYPKLIIIHIDVEQGEEQ